MHAMPLGFGQDCSVSCVLITSDNVADRLARYQYFPDS